MTAERWRQVKAIFHDAVERDPAARTEFLRQSCGNDTELRREVESLLDSEQRPASRLETPVLATGAIAAAVPVHSSAPMIGRVIGNYIVIAQIARGGMGIVYRARHATLPRDAVVKCIRPLAFSEEEQNQLRARFRREAHIQSQLDDPHIVRVYEFFDFADEYLLVMEYVPGASVRSMLDSCGRLPAEQAVALAIQALQGLAHAHGLHYVDESGNTGVGVIHRDIKPGNLLVEAQGLLKVTDFGIAQVSGKGHLTKTGFNPGTVEYMSPEQIRGQPVDARSDLYSLGVTLYEMLAGRVPFPRTDEDSGYDLLKAHVETDPPPIRKLNPDIPGPLADVITRSLQRDVSQRWQTADDFREALVAWQENRPVTQGSMAPRKRRWWIVGWAALALMLASGAWWLRPGGKEAPSVAVLPFVDWSAGKDQAYLADGVTEELINGLANTPGLRVPGRTSSFQFKGKTGDFSVIGKQLHVGTILEGSVRKQGNRVRITVQLIQATTGFHLWSHSYDKELNENNIFAVQEDIARAVTAALKVTLLGGKTEPQPAKSANPEAYTAYLQGVHFLERQTQAGLEKAAGYFEQATKLDPGFAKAWVGLADCRRMQAGSAYIPVNEGYQKAQEAVDRALALDENLGSAYAVQGEIRMLRFRDWAGANASFQRALTLLPGDAAVMRDAGSLNRLLGRLDEAIRLYRRAIEIDPLLGQRSLGLNLYYAGRLEEATAALRNALELNPEMPVAHALLAQVYLAQSRPHEALVDADKETDPTYRAFVLILAHYALGDKRESDEGLAELIARHQTDAPYQLAEVYAFRGETNSAFKWLERAYAGNDPGITEMKADPLLKNLRGDPRYTAMLKKINLPL